MDLFAGINIPYCFTRKANKKQRVYPIRSMVVFDIQRMLRAVFHHHANILPSDMGACFLGSWANNSIHFNGKNEI